jgi:hypothetical protein
LAVNPKSTRQISPGTGLGIFLFHHIQDAKVFVGAAITITKQIGFFFQVEDCGREAAAFLAREFGKLSENLGCAHEQSH